MMEMIKYQNIRYPYLYRKSQQKFCWKTMTYLFCCFVSPGGKIKIVRIFEKSHDISTRTFLVFFYLFFFFNSKLGCHVRRSGIEYLNKSQNSRLQLLRKSGRIILLKNIRQCSKVTMVLKIAFSNCRFFG